MYLLLSGEGSGDIGLCKPAADFCDFQSFEVGPMGWVVDQLVEKFQGFEFSHLENNSFGFVSKSYLANNKEKPRKKSISLRGKKRPVETQLFYENARAMAVVAKMKSEEIKDQVVAVLFRDSDGTVSADRGNWRDKRESMCKGFKAEDFDLGVAMVPKPKSEAWLLCALKDNPYQHCKSIEEGSGNDEGKNPLKDQLSAILSGKNNAVENSEKVKSGQIDVHRIDMPSFNVFKADLEIAVKAVVGGRP